MREPVESAEAGTHDLTSSPAEALHHTERPNGANQALLICAPWRSALTLRLRQDLVQSFLTVIPGQDRPKTGPRE